MATIINIITVLTLSISLFSETVVSDGLFYMQRIPSSCVETTFETIESNDVSDNCFTFNWDQIRNSTTNYTTYTDPNTNATYYAQIGAVTVLGMIDNYDLDYQCPPNGYNGAGPGCNVLPDTQLVVMHINVLDGKLYAIDVILSSAPFPSPQNLTDNQPPFGKASHIFNSGIAIQSTGYFKICKRNTSDQCPNNDLQTHVLPNPLPSNYGYGVFGIQANQLITTSTWIMDDLNQLLIITAGTSYYYFNGTGFFAYDFNSNICMWITACNYRCEAYNYNSRFLDYAGEWIITKKWSLGEIQPVLVEAWIGNAIDAAGVFPIIMYVDKKTGHYIGLDKLDLIGSSTMGAMYWYTHHGNTTPRISIEAFHPNVVDVNCTTILRDWTGLSDHGICLRFNLVQILAVLIFLKN